MGSFQILTILVCAALTVNVWLSVSFWTHLSIFLRSIAGILLPRCACQEVDHGSRYSSKPAPLSPRSLLIISSDFASPTPCSPQNPTWLTELSSLPEHTPPFEVSLSAGSAIRMTVGRFVNLHAGESVYQYEFYLGESSVSEAPEDFRTVALDGDGDVDRKNWRADADRLVIRVLEGRIQVKVGQPFAR